MSKRKIIFAVIIALFLLFIGINAYNWIMRGNQTVSLYIPQEAYSNGSFSVQLGATDGSTRLDVVSSKVELLDKEHKSVKNVSVDYNNDIATIKVPEVEAGTYYIKAVVTTSKGFDEIEKAISISSKAKENVIITFDKGIYKPGDTVNFRALVLNKNNNTPITTDANISIYDGNDNRVYNKDLKTSDYGITFGSFKLGDEVNSGLYKLTLKTEESEITKQFKVNPYVLPKYEVTIKTDKDNYLINDDIEITANARYFFGEPVVDAEISFYVDGKPIGIARTNSEGNASKIFDEAEYEKVYSVKIEAQDSSNYYVEANSSFNVGRDLIKLEILPEYGKLVSNEKNKIYVLTKDVYGTPVKTYLNVTAGTFKKQVITDENGVGTFDLDIGSSNYQDITIKAENMSGDIVNISKAFECQAKDVLIKTDKTKYVQGEEITLKVDSVYDYNTIYVCKDNNVLKVFSKVDNECKFDLGDSFGLIDIYVQNKNARGRYYDYDTYSYKTEPYFMFKKTIFVMPKESLAIAINKDKDVYKPGENIKLSFEAKDENNNKVDTALLVSMLDNSILSLADNDLSIDNIRLALEGIKISEDIDAATLYSAILNEESEQDLISLLLKQGDKALDVNTYSQKDYDVKVEYMANTIQLILFFMLFLIIWAYLFNKKVKIIIGDILNVIVLFYMTCMFAYAICENISWGLWYDIWLPCLIVAGIFTLTLYVLVIAKFIREHVTRTTIYSILSLILIMGIIWMGNLIGAWILVVFALALVLIIVLKRMLKKGKIKDEKKANFVKKLLYKFKDYLTFVLSQTLWIFGFSAGVAIIFGIINAIVYYSYDLLEWLNAILIPITLVTYYLISYAFYRLIVNRNGNKELPKKEIPADGLSTGIIIGVVITVIGIVIIASLGVLLFNRAQDVAMSSVDSISSSRVYESDSNDSDITHIFDSAEPQALSGIGTSTPSNIFGNILQGIGSNTMNGGAIYDDYELTEAISSDETQASQDEHIRNVFLESMCFVPELITENGEATLDLILSDNITTWTIQTIGNTKDGRVGYGKIDNVKVFKEFFADFELPKNLVKGDKVSIPVTIYNYTENPLEVSLLVKEQSWFSIIGNYDNKVSIGADEAKLVYIPIEVLATGNNSFRVDAKSAWTSDIIEKTASVVPNGFKIEKLVTSGVLNQDIQDDILLLDTVLDNSAKAKIKIYSNTISQIVEGIENILEMPTGCFEQVSSSLYPDIVALRYLQENKLDNEEIRNKAFDYISTGYQKLLSYEVGKSGGFSLYGDSPAETVLTAYGLMEFKDLESVYDVDENVIDRMVNYLFGRQKLDGSFNVEGWHTGGLDYGSDELAENAYIVWALSEAVPEDNRITKSINYLSNNIENAKDAYTLSLIANALVNAKGSSKDKAISKLIDMVTIDEDKAYVSSHIRDYYGSCGSRQNVQTTALVSLALSKDSSHIDVNKKLINYIASNKDYYGTWYSTQNTVLCLKALNEYSAKGMIKDQTIKVEFNSKQENIEINGNALDVYTVTFDNVSKENKLKIDFDEGEALYEVLIEYYKPFDEVDLSQNQLAVNMEYNNNLRVNDILNAKLTIENKSNINIVNEMIVVNIPQGFVAIEESLNKLVAKGLIEKYEMNYRTINLYVRNFAKGESHEMDIQFRASYPVNITGMQVRAYDYYNPDIEGYSLPKAITVQ